MRFLPFIFCILAHAVYADEPKLNAADYEFRKNQPVHVFEFSPPDSSKTYRVCCGTFQERGGARAIVSVGVAEEVSDCEKPERFGETEDVFIQRAVLAGRKMLTDSMPCSGREEISKKSTAVSLSR